VRPSIEAAVKVTRLDSGNFWRAVVFPKVEPSNPSPKPVHTRVPETPPDLPLTTLGGVLVWANNNMPLGTPPVWSWREVKKAPATGASGPISRES
jgi:hypothetical protein